MHTEVTTGPGSCSVKAGPQGAGRDGNEEQRERKAIVSGLPGGKGTKGASDSTQLLAELEKKTCPPRAGANPSPLREAMRASPGPASLCLQ